MLLLKRYFCSSWTARKNLASPCNLGHNVTKIGVLTEEGPMRNLRGTRTIASALMVLALLVFCPARGHARGVLLMEEPYGFFGALFPVGHSAIYLDQVCAETPLVLRRCRAGELGTVVTRNSGIAGYDWVAIPLVPYLYSVENPSEIPAHADSKAVWRIRNRYHESHLLSLGDNLIAGNFIRGGWALLVGVSYERRIYAFSFETTPEQDDALITRMNAGENRSHFNYLFNNCSDFDRSVLNIYFPHTFRRSLFTDAAITTPKTISHKLVQYARKHPEMRLTIFEIPQIPGYRRQSHPNKGVAEGLLTTGYTLPIALANPYIAGGIVVEYIVRGRFHLIPRHPQIIGPGDLMELTAATSIPQNPESAGVQATGAAASRPVETQVSFIANSGLRK
jgi:hypothetical protein